MKRFKDALELVRFLFHSYQDFGRLPKNTETAMIRCVKTFQGR